MLVGGTDAVRWVRRTWFTLFASILYVVTARGIFAICSTGIGCRVAVLSAVVALFASIFYVVTARGISAIFSACIGCRVTVLVAIVALLAVIPYVVTAKRLLAIHSTGISLRVAVLIAVIAFFAGLTGSCVRRPKTVVDVSISATRPLASSISIVGV